MLNRDGDNALLTARSVSPAAFPAAYHILRRCFPAEELASRGAFEARFREPHCDALLFHLGEARDTQKPVGLSIGWSLYDFYFLEYLALIPEIRGKHLGSRWIQSLKEQHRSIVLEIECPETKAQERRLRFYERLDFCVLDKNYTMPAVRSATVPLPMWLLSTNGALDPVRTTRTIYREVYPYAMRRPRNAALRYRMGAE